MYKRGNSLWVAFKDERGIRVCKPSGYKVGEEPAARALLAELERKATDAQAESAVLQVERNDVTPSGPAPNPTAVAPAPIPGVGTGPTVREYGERWLQSRAGIETIGDERGRLRNHVFPRIGDLRMREVRPRHIRDFILGLKTSNVHRRGTGKGLGTSKVAPRTVRHVFSLVSRMFSAAVIDEVIDTSPVLVAKGVLPKNVDKDPAWRATAMYERGELVRLVSDPIVPPERRMLNAIKGLAGTRHGEAAGLRWSNYFADVQPLGKLVVARSYDKDGTKTKISRLVPVHPALAQLLAEWKRSGWVTAYGRAPTLQDLIVPRSVAASSVDDAEAPWDNGAGETLWCANHAHKMFLEDLEALGMRRRRGHDLRRTFITLAQEDGARRDVLQVITHAPNAADIMSLYTTYPWPTLCAEVAKLKIDLPDASPAPGASARLRSMPTGVPPAAGPTLTIVRSEAAAELPALELRLATSRPELRALEVCPKEPRTSVAPVLAETLGAPRSFGGVAVAHCSATVSATCSAENPVISSRCPGLNRGPTVYETVALPLSYSGVVRGNWYPRHANRASGPGREAARLGQAGGHGTAVTTPGSPRGLGQRRARPAEAAATKGAREAPVQAARMTATTSAPAAAARSARSGESIPPTATRAAVP